MLPWLVDMLALTCAGSVGTLPVRGGLFGLLAGWAAGYWQLAPRSAGALNAGSWPLAAGAGSVGAAERARRGGGGRGGRAVGVAAGEEEGRHPGDHGDDATTEAMIVYSRRLRACAARRSS